MKPEEAFDEQVQRDLHGEFFIEHTELRYGRGYPDTNMFDARSDNIALVELKVTNPFARYTAHQPVSIKSLKPHQINWLESRACIGGRNRRNVGMLLRIAPFIVYVTGNNMKAWRGKPPSMIQIFELARTIFYIEIDPEVFRARLFREDVEISHKFAPAPIPAVYDLLYKGQSPKAIANELGRVF